MMVCAEEPVKLRDGMCIVKEYQIIMKKMYDSQCNFYTWQY